MVTSYVLPPILKPLLYGVVCLILEITQLSGAPNPESGPVRGWIQPMVMALVLPPEAPFRPELHAARNPPVLAATAPTPIPLSSERLLICRSIGTVGSDS